MSFEISKRFLWRRRRRRRFLQNEPFHVSTSFCHNFSDITLLRMHKSGCKLYALVEPKTLETTSESRCWIIYLHYYRVELKQRFVCSVVTFWANSLWNSWEHTNINLFNLFSQFNDIDSSNIRNSLICGVNSRKIYAIFSVESFANETINKKLGVNWMHQRISVYLSFPLSYASSFICFCDIEQ